jgi:putative ABC transport system permease protein
MPWNVLLHQLRRAWFRVALTGGGVALAIFLMATLRTVNTSLEQTVKAAGGNRLIVSSAVSLFVFLPQKMERDLRAEDGVREVNHWTWFGGVYIDERNMFARFATDPLTLRRVYGDQTPGREDIVLPPDAWEAFAADRIGCIVGIDLAERYGWEVGDTIELEGNIFPGSFSFTIRGIYRRGTQQMDEQTMFFHWTYLDEASGRPGAVSTLTLDLEPGTDLAAVARSVDGRYASSDHRTRTMTEAAFNQMFVSMWGNVPLLLSTIGIAVLFAAFMIALNTMLLHGQERRLDIGVLKALGFPDRAVGGLFVVEGLVVCGLGGAVGAGAAHVVFNVVGAPGIERFFPSFEILPETILLSLATALGVGLVSGIVPAVVATRIPVIDALSRKG